ncbi:transcription initiation factor TFIID subunit A-domain-containing protein [Lipomyces oligophaga]|uniref:transcription initiation factor TFIID subunit A-domain-containing protein n=1 Tax=Lipomyces oligophaga TaxID=45792 RepID=UPI0034CF0405
MAGRAGSPQTPNMKSPMMTAIPGTQRGGQVIRPAGTPGATGMNARPSTPYGQIPNSPAMSTPTAAKMTLQGSPMPIPQTLSVRTPVPAPSKPARPSLNGGYGNANPSLSSPAITRAPAYELNGSSSRVLSKRKLSELVKDIVGTSSSINGEPLLGDERDVTIDGDVEELLLDLADEFVQSVASFSCRLAKHRKSNTLEAKDVQLHLERNWNLRVPGYNADEIRSVRRWNPTQSYLQKISGVNTSRAISGKLT